jgi:hypothetical protein
VDHGALRANQGTIIVLLLGAFLFDAWSVAALTALTMAAGTVLGKPGFMPLYLFMLRPVGLMKSDFVSEDPQPHRFAQGFGAAVLFAASIAFAAGLSTAGWIAVWAVILLAAVNLLTGFCAGCFVYHQLARLGFRR